MTMTRRTPAEVAAVRQLRRALDGTGCSTETQWSARDVVPQRCSASPTPGVVLDGPAPGRSRLLATMSALLIADAVIGGVAIGATSHHTSNLVALVIVLVVGMAGAATLTRWWALAHSPTPRTQTRTWLEDADRPLAVPSHWLA